MVKIFQEKHQTHFAQIVRKTQTVPVQYRRKQRKHFRCSAKNRAVTKTWRNLTPFSTKMHSPAAIWPVNKFTNKTYIQRHRQDIMRAWGCYSKSWLTCHNLLARILFFSFKATDMGPGIKMFVPRRAIAPWRNWRSRHGLIALFCGPLVKHTRTAKFKWYKVI